MARKESNVAQTDNLARVPSRPGAAHAIQPTEDFISYVKEYARERPEVAALWCFGAGFVLGWKLKFW